ncbi:MAG: phosphoglycerate dehydrogenase [Candidatus Vogelbacteria bacterium]|nr:phosphoglycerate dehydrogenase [Candidatus Vogelbacteria bacterium]
MRWKVLISAPYMQPVIDDFRSIFSENNIEIIVPKVEERLSEEDLLPIIGEIDGVICGDDRFTKKVLQKAKKLKVIAKWGTGIDSIDQKAAKELNIAVCNTPNAFTDPVADSVLGYILSFARQITRSTKEMQAGHWRKIPGVALQECTLGIIGLGSIGKAVAKRAIAFGMTVFGNDIKEDVGAAGVVLCSQEDIFKRADFVSLHCDLNPTSVHLINKQTLSFMKPSAYLINTARGPIIDEEAMIKALLVKQIAGAALDVFEVEPLSKNSPLRKMDNCLLASHNANSSPSAWQKVHQNTINNLLTQLRKSS